MSYFQAEWNQVFLQNDLDDAVEEVGDTEEPQEQLMNQDEDKQNSTDDDEEVGDTEEPQKQLVNQDEDKQNSNKFQALSTVYYDSSSSTEEVKKSDKNLMEVDEDEDEPARPDPTIKFKFEVIMFRTRSCHRGIQSFNGPCPVLAIMNTLLLTGRCEFTPPNLPVELSYSDLMNVHISPHLWLDRITNLVATTLAKIPSGLMVNSKFNDVDSFHDNCAAFQLFRALKIQFFHTLVVPEFKDQDFETVTSDFDVAQQLESDYPKLYSQLGVYTLYQKMKAGLVAVLFHSNHFWTIYKRPEDNIIYQLITHTAMTRKNVIWQTFNPSQEMFLDSPIFVDASFVATNNCRRKALDRFRATFADVMQ